MLKIDVRNVVHAIVEQELSGKGRDTEALYLNFDLRMSQHLPEGFDGKSYDESRGLHLLYQVNPGFSYINVFSGVTDSPFARIRDVAEWKHECTHDSCWRDINTFSQVYFEMAECINAARKADGFPPVAPANMHEWHSIGRAGLFQWVKANVRKDPNCERNYRRIVEVL